MTSQLLSAPTLLLESTTHHLRPRYEGANICTWIGFKHVNYLVEEAVLAHFRELGRSARTLYENHGLCVEFVDLDTRIGSAFHLDDEVVAEVSAAGRPRRTNCGSRWCCGIGATAAPSGPRAPPSPWRCVPISVAAHRRYPYPRS